MQEQKQEHEQERREDKSEERGGREEMMSSTGSIRRKGLGAAFFFVCLTGTVGVGAEANPIPCERLTATRAQNAVALTMELVKECYQSPPPTEDVVVRRDLFVVDMSLVLTESETEYTLSATDFSASSKAHHYDMSFVSNGNDIIAHSSVQGSSCASLDGSLGSQGADLFLTLDTSCMADPSATLEYTVRHDWEELLELSWVESEEGGVIEATATDELADQDMYHTYEVGVRAGEETYYGTVDVYQSRHDASVPSDGGDDETTSGAGGGDGGCNATSSSPGRYGAAAFYLLFLLVLGRIRKGRETSSSSASSRRR
jgi:hypothetical protein